jgi:hypothetical protein
MQCGLIQISEKYKGKAITLVLDNAKYQHCNFVTQFAETVNIGLKLFLRCYEK